MRLTHLAVLLVLALPVGARAQPATAAWGELLVPGGVGAARRSFGMIASADRPEALFLIDFADRFAALRNQRAIQDAGRYFRTVAGSQGLTASELDRPTVLPLPAPAVWDALGVPRGPDRIAAIIERDDLTLLYRGLMSLDDDTLEYIARTPSLVPPLVAQARPFAVFGRSLRVRPTGVQLPGGGAGRETWVHLVGQTPADPAAFLPALLAADDGRLIYFFDALWRLDAVRQTAVLGAERPATERAGHVDAVYRVFKRFEPKWSVREEPFQLRAFDPAVALALTDMSPDGTFGPDWWPALLQRIVAGDGWPNRPGDVGSLRPATADVRWLLEWLFAEPDDARRRYELVRYLQRQFPAAGPGDAFGLETALRTLREMPALALSLERMGVRDAALIGAVGRRARQLTRAGRVEDVVPRLARWQSGVGWLEQIHRHRPIEPQVIHALLTALAQDPGRADDGEVATWLVEQLLPALGAGGDGMTESSLLARMLDAGPIAATVEWEGLTYHLRPDRAAQRTVLSIRGAQTGPRLDDLVSLVHVARRIAATPESLDLVRVLETELQARLPALQTLVEQRLLHEGVTSDLERVIRTLSRIERESDLERATREHARLLWISDQVAGLLAPQMLYALAAAPTNRSPMFYADGWQRHGLAAQSPTERRSWTALVWDPAHAVVVPAGDSAVQGSLIGLDLALGEAELRDTEGMRLLAPPVLTGPDRASMVQALRLARPAAPDPTAEGQDVVARIAAGRAELLAWAPRPPASADVRAKLEAAGVDERRVNLLLWAAARGGAADGWLAVSEIYRLGGGDVLPASWGLAGRAVDGCWCYESHVAWRARWLGDRAGSGLAGAAVMDLSLRLAEHLAALDLPPPLAVRLLRSGMREWVDQVWQNMPSDAAALAEFPARLPLDRLDEYLLALVADGFLVVASGGVQ